MLLPVLFSIFFPNNLYILRVLSEHPTEQRALSWLLVTAHRCGPAAAGHGSLARTHLICAW